MTTSTTARVPIPRALLAAVLAALAVLTGMAIGGHANTAHASTTPSCYVVLIPYEDGSWSGGPLVYTDANGVVTRYFTGDADGFAAHLATLGWLPAVKVGNGPLVSCALTLSGGKAVAARTSGSRNPVQRRPQPAAAQLAEASTDTSWPVTYLYPDTTWTATRTVGTDGYTRVVLSAPGIDPVSVTWATFRALFTPPVKPVRRT